MTKRKRSSTKDRRDYMSVKNAEWRAKNPEKHAESYRQWFQANKAKRNEYMREWRKKNPEKANLNNRRNMLKRNYNMTLEDYDYLLAAQGGKCALCDRTPEQERYKCLNVDHCHETGRVRGLLCTPHNHAIGMFGDTEAGVRRVLEYLGETKNERLPFVSVAA